MRDDVEANGRTPGENAAQAVHTTHDAMCRRMAETTDAVAQARGAASEAARQNRIAQVTQDSRNLLRSRTGR